MHRLSVASAGEEVTVRVPVSGGIIEKTVPYGVLTLAGLGVFLGCAGKSAQAPLHVWLPDAMAGPTPVSALIHAATMVAAGVYLVGRLFPLFSADVLEVIAYTGGITLLIGASIASVQTDYKKVLAYSTISQLGFMMLAMGVGGWAAGLFHLLTHAFFKALLFLGAGSVYRAVHTYELASLGGLRRRMPTTAWTMMVGTLAISGVPLLSGFYSKDAILADAAHLVWIEPGSWALFVIPAVGTLLTAFYMFRMWFLMFDGEARSESARRAVESPKRLTVPLMILAVLAVVSGWPVTLLPISTPVLEGWLKAVEPLPAVDVSEVRYLAMGASVLVAALGFALAAGYYSRWKLASPRPLGPVQSVLVNRWYFDTTLRGCAGSADPGAGSPVAPIRPGGAGPGSEWLGLADEEREPGGRVPGCPAGGRPGETFRAHDLCAGGLVSAAANRVFEGLSGVPGGGGGGDVRGDVLVDWINGCWIIL